MTMLMKHRKVPNHLKMTKQFNFLSKMAETMYEALKKLGKSKANNSVTKKLHKKLIVNIPMFKVWRAGVGGLIILKKYSEFRIQLAQNK